MATRYKIHPGIGIARLGNSPDEFCISPEEPAALPLDCDAEGNPLKSPDGESELRIETFKDAAGRIKRQAARFQVYVYDDDSPEGRPLQLGDPVSGGGNQGHLVDIQWRVHLANKKASWYEFSQLEGEHGYAPGHPRRNASVTDPEARRRLIIDPGPRVVDHAQQRSASFSDDESGTYGSTFPPELKPRSIDTLGELKTDDDGRLLVLGGHGNSGSYLWQEFGQPRIDSYANTEGWFDDTSDGPVMARLTMFSTDTGSVKYLDVEYPAWVIVGYPAYVPQILDIVTMDEAMYDMFVREFAYRTDLYGEAGTFSHPERIDAADREAILHWQRGRLEWNPRYKPWFYRDIWHLLFRADEYSWLNNALALSNYPHNQSPRGNFDPSQLGVPPRVRRDELARVDREAIDKHSSGQLLVDAARPALEGVASEEALPPLQQAVAAFAGSIDDHEAVADADEFLHAWRAGVQSDAYAGAKADLDRALDDALGPLSTVPDDPAPVGHPRVLVNKLVARYESGQLLEEWRAQRLAAATDDPYRDYRRFLFDALRRPGEENQLRNESKPSSRVHGLPLMPLSAGDNPLSNTLPSKFFRLTDVQYFMLRQWARGQFVNEAIEGWPHPDPWTPYANWVNRSGHDLDRGVLSNVLGGAFCPGGEVGWIMRNPAIYAEPYRIKADPDFALFRLTAAQQTGGGPGPLEPDIVFAIDAELSQDDDFSRGMQPGDLTKHMALPWQADFNECTTQMIDVTYEQWNVLYASSERDSLTKRERMVWETLWWPAHRPLQTSELTVDHGVPGYSWSDWSMGIPQTKAGDLEMVTAWSGLPFVRLNPYAKPVDLVPTEVPPTPSPKYVSVERSQPPKEE